MIASEDQDSLRLGREVVRLIRENLSIAERGCTLRGIAMPDCRVDMFIVNDPELTAAFLKLMAEIRPGYVTVQTSTENGAVN